MLEAFEHDDRVEAVGEPGGEQLGRIALLEGDVGAGEAPAGLGDRAGVDVDAGDADRGAGDHLAAVAGAAAEVEHAAAGAELGGELVAVAMGHRYQRPPFRLIGRQALDYVHLTSASFRCAANSPASRSRFSFATPRIIDEVRIR